MWGELSLAPLGQGGELVTNRRVRLQVFVVATPPVPCHLGVLLLDIVLIKVDLRVHQHQASCYGRLAADLAVNDPAVKPRQRNVQVEPLPLFLFSILCSSNLTRCHCLYPRHRRNDAW